MRRIPTVTIGRCPTAALTVLAVVALGACGGSLDAQSGPADIVPQTAPIPTVALTAPPLVTVAAATTTPPTPSPTSPVTSIVAEVASTDAAPVTEPTETPNTVAAPTTQAPTTLPPSTDPLAPFLELGYEKAPAVTQPVGSLGKNSGPGTRVLQQRLLDLGFWVNGVDGEYGHTTTQGVMAFQKYNSIPVTGSVDDVTAAALNSAMLKGKGTATEGDVIEVDKTKQLLHVVKGGKTLWTLNASTGNGKEYEEEDQNTPGEIIRGVSLTPNGMHKVNRERPEGWWEGDLGKIYRPKYFVGGVAVHGSGSIPAYPASHGCVRVSTSAMDWIWDSNLMPIGTPVWVHGGENWLTQ